MNVRERIPENQREGALEKLARLSHAEVLKAYLTQRLTRSGTVLDVSIISTALLDAAGKIYAIATTERAKPQDRPKPSPTVILEPALVRKVGQAQKGR
jgi:two-component system CheB/CheR fusion protein